MTGANNTWGLHTPRGCCEEYGYGALGTNQNSLIKKIISFCRIRTYPHSGENSGGVAFDPLNIVQILAADLPNITSMSN